MSTLALRALLAFLDAGQFVLCQQFIYNNPAKLPGPAQWVTVERIRVKDSYSHLWWMSSTDRPKATNRRILQPYSESMLKLFETKKYNAGSRPSEHHIGKTSFFRKHKGAIPSNVITLANTQASSAYLNYCRSKNLTLHPARMPIGLAEFFIKFLTKPGDLVLDPFAGSNTTGAASEALRRKWISITDLRQLALSYRKNSDERVRRATDGQRDAAVNRLETEIESDYLRDFLTTYEVPNHRLIKKVNDALKTVIVKKFQPTLKAKINKLVVSLYLVKDMSPNDPYVIIESTESETSVIVIINLAHPHWSQLTNAESIANFIRHCTYDGVSEWKAYFATGEIHPDTVKLIKDNLLRIPLRLEGAPVRQ